jgi:UDP-N-acetylmuramyl pentapeptide phosphotransferase/UDP-N-acetylglucosamine-1-phosphate transferase
MLSVGAMIDLVGIDRPLLALGTVFGLAAILTTGLIIVAWPWLKGYALARPNARSSHHTPTPQGGGIAVIVATIAAAWTTIAVFPTLLHGHAGQFLTLTAAATLLALVGAIDDIRPVAATPRLLLQSIAVGIVVAALPKDVHLLPLVPWWLERVGLLIAGVWFINLTNFMDGIDWMTVAETIPVSAAIVVLGLFDALPALPTLVATALLGAILGFAPFNRPVAKLFLGDVGSLPIGLLLGWLLLQLAASGHLAAAVMLPLYYLADATVTLLRRLAKGEPFWQAHRRHFYQRAIDGGFTVPAIVSRVFLVNVALAALAFVSVAWPNLAVAGATLLIGVMIVAWMLWMFARGKDVSRGKP